MKRWISILVVAAAPLGLVGCEELRVIIQSSLQSALNGEWAPARRAANETSAETLLAAALDEHLEDTSFDVAFSWSQRIPIWWDPWNGWVYRTVGFSVSIPVECFNVDEEDVSLGTVPPRIAIWNFSYVPTADYNTVLFDWGLDWAAGNGASARFHCEFDYDTPGWVPDWAVPEWLAPDHTVTIDNIRGQATGRAIVQVAKRAGVTSRATVTLLAANLDTRVQAEGWFWTVDVSGPVNAELDRILSSRIVGQAITRQIGPNDLVIR